MGLYSYEVVDRQGRSITGKMNADHEIAVADNLRKMGLTVLDVTEVRESPFSALFQRKRKVKIGDLAMFSRQLQTLLESGIPLTRALHTLSYQTTNRDLSQVLNQTAQSVDSGMSFSDSLMNFPDVFSSMYINMIKSGEVSGNLDEVLKQLADQLDRDKSLRDNIKAATFYPLVVLSFAFLVVIAMLVGVVPVFMNFFPEGMELPVLTKIVIGISSSLRSYWYLYIIAIIALVYGIRYYLLTPDAVK